MTCSHGRPKSKFLSAPISLSVNSLLTLIVVALLVIGASRQAGAVTGSDLVVTSLTGPTSGVIGGQINISVTVANQGSANAGPFRLGFYYSTDSTITTSDSFSGFVCSINAGLAAGASFICSGLIAVPSTLLPGTYFLGAIADDLQAVTEVNEGNNSRAADSGTISLQSIPTLTVHNSGNGTVTSKPKGINCGITCSKSFANSATVTLTAKRAKGFIFSGWSGDCSGTATCKVTMNVDHSVTATFNRAGPDLVISSLANPPASVGKTENITVSATVKNQGNIKAGAFRLGFYFSTDANFSSGDILFGICNASGLVAGGSFSCADSLPIPNSLSPGAYFVVACADDRGAVSESDETNNCRASTTTVQIGAPLTISLPTTSALPLTPLQITTSGLIPGQPVSVTFSNNSGFSANQDPIRIDPDGTVVVGVPFFVDPNTSQIAQGTVSVVLKQGNRVSAQVAFTIQDLPPLSSYGTQLGEISHKYLVFEAMLLARRLGQLQTAQLLFPNLDTSNAQSTLSTLLRGTMLARNDVDRILLDNSTVISGGTLSDATPIQFDKISQDIMDRVIGLYLAQLLQSLSEQSSNSGLASVRALSAPLDVKTLLDLLNSHADMVGIITEWQNAANESNPPIDRIYSIIKGATPYLNVLFETGLTEQLGAGFAIFDVLYGTLNMAYDVRSIYEDSKPGGDPQALAQDVANLNSDRVKTLDASVTTLSFGFLKVVEDNTPGSSDIMGLNLAFTHEQILLSLAGLDADETSLAVGGHITNPFPPTPRFCASLRNRKYFQQPGHSRRPNFT